MIGWGTERKRLSERVTELERKQKRDMEDYSHAMITLSELASQLGYRVEWVHAGWRVQKKESGSD